LILYVLADAAADPRFIAEISMQDLMLRTGLQRRRIVRVLERLDNGKTIRVASGWMTGQFEIELTAARTNAKVMWGEP
jgi:hypothetical protein